MVEEQGNDDTEDSKMNAKENIEEGFINDLDLNEFVEDLAFLNSKKIKGDILESESLKNDEFILNRVKLAIINCNDIIDLSIKNQSPTKLDFEIKQLINNFSLMSDLKDVIKRFEKYFNENLENRKFDNICEEAKEIRKRLIIIQKKLEKEIK